MIVFIKKHRTRNASISSKNDQNDSLLDNSNVDICGRKFPKSIVKEWTAITLGQELGGGQFGKVYKGFLHLNELQSPALVVNII